jgi:hypothetical protein
MSQRTPRRHAGPSTRRPPGAVASGSVASGSSGGPRLSLGDYVVETGSHEGGARRRRAFMLPILPPMRHPLLRDSITRGRRLESHPRARPAATA